MEIGKKKQASKKNDVSKSRSPLQDLNGVSIYKKNCWKSCTNSSSSSSSSVSVEAPKGCLRSLVSSNSSSSSTSYLTKTVITKKPKPPFKFTSSRTQKSAAAGGRGGNSVVLRSKENDIRRKQIPQKLRKNQSPSIYQRKINKKSTLSTPRNPEKGIEELGQKLKNSQQIGPGQSTVANFTPADKMACGSGLEFSNLDENKNIRENTNSTALASNGSASTKTPPVEASVSPEIQCGSHSKVLVSTAAVTPICYGAGHLVSGVTDKRKCRSRGILTVGLESVNLFEYGSNEGIVRNDSRASFIPMPAEASLHWLSPCDEVNEGNESDLEKKMENCRIIKTGSESLLLDLESSPSTLIGTTSDFVCDSDSYGVDSNVADIASTGKTRDVCLQLKQIDKFSSDDTPHHTPTAKVISSREEIGDSARVYTGSLSGGNVIQTPDSNSSIERHVKDYEHQRRQLDLDFESTEILHGVSISSGSKRLICDVNQLPQKNSDKTSVFDSMSENLSLSQMRISWRDGLVSQVYEMDEFDCCRCLSDEEVDAEGCSNKESGLKSLECEPYPSGKGKEILSPHQRNSCAESISTNGGGLIASGDSDWTICYKNHFF